MFPGYLLLTNYSAACMSAEFLCKKPSNKKGGDKRDFSCSSPE